MNTCSGLQLPKGHRGCNHSETPARGWYLSSLTHSSVCLYLEQPHSAGGWGNGSNMKTLSLSSWSFAFAAPSNGGPPAICGYLNLNVLKSGDAVREQGPCGSSRAHPRLSGASSAAPHPTWRPRRARGSASPRAPEVRGGPAPCRGLCGTEDAPALSIPGRLGGRPWGCGSGSRGSARRGHGQLRRGTAGASLRCPPCPAASAPLGLSHPDSGPPASFLSRPPYPAPSFLSRPRCAWSSSPRPWRRPALVLPVPTLALASACPFHPAPAPSRPPGLRPDLRRHELSPGSVFHAFPSPAVLVAPSLTRLSAPTVSRLCRPPRHLSRAPVPLRRSPSVTASHPSLYL